MIQPTEQNPTPEQLAILNELAQRGNMLLCAFTMEQLGDKMGINATTAGQILLGMEIKGLVEHDGAFERSSRITERGRGFATEPQFIRLAL